ncbi:MAG: hypothetical protein HDS07_08320 [Bacteroides sp.]|nr:hypothetical protein [Bacteroides sp.]
MKRTSSIVVAFLLSTIFLFENSATAQSFRDWLDEIWLEKNLSDSYSSLTEYLKSDLSSNLDGDFLWRYNFPYDFPRQDDSIFFSIQDFAGDEWFENALKNEPDNYCVWNIQNYFFWLSGKHLIINNNEVFIRYDKDDDSDVRYDGDTYNLLPFGGFGGFSVLSLEEDNQWKEIWPDKYMMESIWLDARFNNDIDGCIKRELSSLLDESDEELDTIIRECLIAPMYQDIWSTLFNRLWTINPSYLNDTSYTQWNYNGTYLTRSDPKLYAARFNPIRTHLESNNLSQCYLCEPKFALTGDTLSIRLVFNLCTLKPNGEITKQTIKTLDSTYKYASPYKSSPEMKHWIKQK